jgi:hypothetical protein
MLFARSIIAIPYSTDMTTQQQIFANQSVKQSLRFH